MKKIYPHAVIYNGVFYPANTEITVAEVKEEKATISEKETVAEEKPKKRGAK